MRSSDRGTVVVQPPRPRYFDKVFICEPRSADRTAGTGRGSEKISLETAKWVRIGSVIGGETTGIAEFRRDTKLQVGRQIDLIAPDSETGPNRS